MAPTSKKGEWKGSASKTVEEKDQQHQRRNSKSQDNSQTPVISPTYSSSGRTNGGDRERSRGNRRRRRPSSPVTGKTSAIRETLSAFGDDVIKVKNYPKLYGYDNHGYFQPDISFDPEYEQGIVHDEKGKKKSKNREEGIESSSSTAAPYGGGENELATIISHHSRHDPSFQTRHFEKVDPSEVGVRASRWQRLFQTSTSTSTFQKFRKSAKEKAAERRRNETEWSTIETFYEGDDPDERISIDPPFWGVSRRTRDKISMLSLCLILHEVACFTSCVLLGSTILQGMEAISWIHLKPFTENPEYFRWYSSFQTLLVVITCLGFLNRVDTTERRSFWVLPLFLVPVLSLSISDYCNKAWELQRLECINYHRLDKFSQQMIHLSQDCSRIENAMKVQAELLKTAPAAAKFPTLVPGSEQQINENHKSQSTPNDIPLGTTASDKVIKSETEIKSVVNNQKEVKIEPSFSSSTSSWKTQTDFSSVTELSTRSVAPLVMRIISAISALIISTYLFCFRKTYFLIDLFGPPKELIRGDPSMIFRITKKKDYNDKGFVNSFQEEFGGTGDYVSSLKYGNRSGGGDADGGIRGSLRDEEEDVEILYHRNNRV